MVKCVGFRLLTQFFIVLGNFEFNEGVLVGVGYETGVEKWIGVGSTTSEPLFLFNRFIYNSELLFQTILEE